MENSAYTASNSGAGVINTDTSAYKAALAKRKQDKYIKGLEQKICKLESAMVLLEKTVKEITK